MHLARLGAVPEVRSGEAGRPHPHPRRRHHREPLVLRPPSLRLQERHHIGALREEEEDRRGAGDRVQGFGRGGDCGRNAQLLKLRQKGVYL